MVLPVLYSCSVISTEMKTEAGPDVDFWHMMEFTDGYLGQTVILGGYVIETENREALTLIKVLHSPLDMTDSPGAKDSSLGRFIVVYDGFLDPAVYTKDRRVTVAGVVEPPEVQRIGTKDVKYLKLRSREIYLHTEKGPDCYDHGYWSQPYHRPSIYYRRAYRPLHTK